MNDCPVILICYNRPWHTAQVLNALERHNIQNLYIFSDAPKTEDDVQGVLETRDLLKNINWTTAHVTFQTENQGLAKSIVGATNYVFEKYDRLILLEDDCVPQEYFFDFMHECLNRYEDNEQIFGISGYTVPVPEHILASYPYDNYFFPRIGSWGWATWKRAWDCRCSDLDQLTKMLLEKEIDLNQGGSDVPVMVDLFLQGKLKDVWTLPWVLTVYLHGGCYVYPTRTHIDNIGMDGSGIHCGATDIFKSPAALIKPAKYAQEVFSDSNIISNFRSFYDIPTPTPVTAVVDCGGIPQQKINILQINTADVQGGAARAAYRLHKGLQQIGFDSRMLVKDKVSDDDTALNITIENNAESSSEEFFLSTIIQGQYINAHRTDISNTIFSLPYPGYDLSNLPVVQNADIINLHWVTYFQSPVTLQRLFALGKPVVWTLHDQWPFTGGCHYSAGCDKYQLDCANCPQLADDPFDLAAAILQDKVKLFKDANLTIVTPSRWLASCARESKLFKGLRVEVIPNSLETDLFAPIPKGEAKKNLGIAEEIVTLLFGAESGAENRKGFRELAAAIQHCLSLPEFKKLVSANKIKILSFGHPSEELEAIGIPVVSLGYLDSDVQMTLAYSAADIFVLPSLEDNLPNTMLEAMSCGTPVVSFDVGGMPDVIKNDVTGKIIPFGNTQQLGEAISALVYDSILRENMGRNCRKLMEEEFGLKMQAQRYMALYETLLGPQEPAKQYSHADSETTVHSTTLCIDTVTGPVFKDVYDHILSRFAKEYIFNITKKLQACESDNTAKLQVGQNQELTKICETLKEKLQACESENAAKLQVIERQDQELAKISETLQGMYSSLSWKLTAPLRSIGKILNVGK